MCRFALRNQGRIITKYGQTFCNNLILYLGTHFDANPEIKEYHGMPYNTIKVADIANDKELEFYIIRKMYDCYTLAFKP